MGEVELLEPLDPEAGEAIKIGPIEIEKPEVGRIIRRQTVKYRRADGTEVEHTTKSTMTNPEAIRRFLEERAPERYGDPSEGGRGAGSDQPPERRSND